MGKPCESCDEVFTSRDEDLEHVCPHTKGPIADARKEGHAAGRAEALAEVAAWCEEKIVHARGLMEYSRDHYSFDDAHDYWMEINVFEEVQHKVSTQPTPQAQEPREDVTT